MLDLTPFYLLPPLVALLLRLPSHRVPIENNVGCLLYDMALGTREVPAFGEEATLGILHLGHRRFGNRWDYRWVRGVCTLGLARTAAAAPPATPPVAPPRA